MLSPLCPAAETQVGQGLLQLPGDGEGRGACRGALWALCRREGSKDAALGGVLWGSWAGLSSWDQGVVVTKHSAILQVCSVWARRLSSSRFRKSAAVTRASTEACRAAEAEGWHHSPGKGTWLQALPPHKATPVAAVC